MKVTKSMLHPSLQPYYSRFNGLPALLGNKFAIRLVNRLLFARLVGDSIEGLDCSEVYIPASTDDWKIRARIYRPQNNTGRLPLLLYIHGGGYVMGNPESAAESIRKFIAARPCVVLAPDYRKSYTRPFPAGFNDCYDTLLWARDNAAMLNTRDDRFIVAGHSAGGGLTAAVTLKNRDMGDADIAFQMPIYPMIDDTQPQDPQRFMRTPVWDTKMNRLGWNAYLNDLHNSGKSIPPYAAPARNHDYHAFPPTITFVGDLEPFLQETLDYVDALKKANVEVAFKLFKGCFHGFDGLAPKAEISREALDFTFNRYAEFYDRYVLDAGI